MHLPIRLANQQLIDLYKERWRQIHYLDSLDRRSIVLVVTGISGAIVASPSVAGLDLSLRIALGILAVTLCFGAIYSTIRNRNSMEYSLVVINFIEGLLNERQPCLFPFSGNYEIPSSFSKYSSNIAFSIRGPMILFYSIALVVVLRITVQATVILYKGTELIQIVISSSVSILGMLLIVCWCFQNNWKKLKP